eukprot:6548786-Karenia_brevis.AAC.1
MSVCVLFIDLVKAFDKVIRQVVHGWGHSPPPDRVAYLCELGVSAPASKWMVEYIDARGPLFTQWGGDAKAVQMAETLHSGVWFCVGSCEQAVTSRTGGRQ